MKNIIKGERGVTLISLAATVIIIGIITTMLLYSIKDTDQVGKLTNLYTDIDNLSDKVSAYYSTYGKIPALSKETVNINSIVESDLKENSNNPIGINDEGDFLVIDLNAIENLTLNYGEDFKKIVPNNTINTATDKDLYIINENSHNIFYLKGIEAEGKKYYTNQDKDTEKVDIRYVNNIKLLDGYKYFSGGKDSPIVIVNKQNDNEYYQWCDIENSAYVLSEQNDDLIIRRADLEDIPDNRMTIDLADSEEKDNVLKSVYEFNGFYIKLQRSGDSFSIYTNANGKVEINYFPIDYTNSWSATYDEEGIYRDKNGDTAYIPKGFQISKLKIQNTIKQGLVARKVSGSESNPKITEFVWIAVPKDALKDNNGNAPNSSGEIEENLINYVKVYREADYDDAWFDGVIGGAGAGSGTEEVRYNEMKNKMLQSISQKGGFWISRNEITEIVGNEEVSKNNMTYSDATKEAIKLAKASYKINENNASEETKIGLDLDEKQYQTSLLFGIQWDLACKFVGENLKENSLVSSSNILNLDGNVAEFTLEKSPTNNYVVVRGGIGDDVNKDFSKRTNITNNSSTADANIGFRITVY